MKLLSGIAEGQVLQRLGSRGANTTLRGTASQSGPIHATIFKGKTPVKGWKKRAVGHAVRGKFELNFAGIPTGGPYRLKLECGRDSTEVKSFYVGDVWIMAGQSNMQGIGNMTGKAKTHPLIRNFTMRREWRLAEDPLHLLEESPDTCHTPKQCSVREGEKQRRAAIKGVGVGLFFAHELLRRSRGVPQGLIATAHGGTSMQQWDPKRKNVGGDSLYGSMFLSVEATGQPVAGVLWYQGESDSNPNDGPLYTARMKELVAATRRDFKQPRLPWIVVQIGRYFVDNANPAGWQVIRDLQRTLPDEIDLLDVVPTIDLQLDDAIHIGSQGFVQLGLRMAAAADRLVYGNKKELRSPQLRGARLVEKETRPAPAGIEITFDNVSGSLRAAGEPSGFGFATAEGTQLNLAFKTTLKGNKVYLHLDKKLLFGVDVYYGAGFTPYCNITDARGFSLPALGPIAVGDTKPFAFFPFISEWEKTEIVPPGRKLDAYTLDEVKALPATRKTYAGGFANEHAQWENSSGLCFFHAKIHVDEPMKLEILLGYDGPIRLWLDGQQAFIDMQGTNPCLADKSRAPLQLEPGTHAITVGMDLNLGGAWGFMLRFARRDVTVEQVRTGAVKKATYSV
jgi:sialate O-acetylesterase